MKSFETPRSFSARATSLPPWTGPPSGAASSPSARALSSVVAIAAEPIEAPRLAAPAAYFEICTLMCFASPLT